MRRIERRLAFAESWNNSSRRSAWNSPVDFHLLDYVSEYDNNLMCPICHSPFVDPVVLQECDHCFCRDCLRQTWSISEYQPGIPKGNCPTCRTHCKLMGRGPVSRILVNILDDLVVRCPKHEEGCTSEIKRSEVQNHVNNYCAYTWVECPGQDCELPLRRKDAEECMHFGVTCIDCRQTTHMANLETHWKSECPDRKVSCDLCESMVFYREISLHARESCPAITIPCTGATYGCTLRAKRGAINQHTKQCTFASFAPFLDAQSRRLAELEEQQTLLLRKMQVLEGGFSSVERILQSSEVHHASQSRPGSNRSSMAIIDDDGLSDPLSANLTPYTHLLSLHESLRDEVTRVSSALTDLDGRHSMMILNENLRLKEELAYIGGQVGGLGRQVGWLTGLRLQDNATRGPAFNPPTTALATSRTMPSRADGAEAVAAAISAPRRRLTDEGRTKL
ncbi:TRAF-like signal transducer [Elsinoe ampelina]|uniref:TRAF-like signal transducer n=1 Tax=Elsinoe ampelina TaxID=302913 RepID=A0A6A6G0R1_9PEZI|nr:TRAF-like signal transducer [Elsinoe ampelina]